MSIRCGSSILMAAAMLVGGWESSRVNAQETPRADAAQEAARQQVLQSDQWRQTQHELDEWLAIQRIYTPEQVASLRGEFAARVSTMSAAELQTFLEEMEDRLEVLMSPEAEEARTWLGGILAVARNPEAHIGGPLPDVAHMSASEIRDELQRFQQRQAARRQQQTAFDRGRQQQVQTARDVQAARRDAMAQPRTAATFVEPSYRSPYAPQRPPRQAITGPPRYRIGPWGEPIYWNPLNDWHPWRREW